MDTIGHYDTLGTLGLDSISEGAGQEESQSHQYQAWQELPSATS